MMENTELCIKLLDDIFLWNGEFRPHIARLQIDTMHQAGQIDTEQYLNLLDACNHREMDGHYRNCLIYKRAENTVTVSVRKAHAVEEERKRVATLYWRNQKGGDS